MQSLRGSDFTSRLTNEIMCGRFTLKTPPDQWGQLLLPIIDSLPSRDGWEPRYNIAPTQNILAVANAPDETLQLGYYRWGLVPSWATDLTIGNRMINARAETLLEKRSFANLLQERRCMIVVDGYYEWQKLSSGKTQPYWISPAEDSVICLAGLWDQNRRATGEPVNTCTIITTAASKYLSDVHDRMPVVLTPMSTNTWMNPECDASTAQSLLGPADNDFFRITKVGMVVNNARNEVRECLQPYDGV